MKTLSLTLCAALIALPIQVNADPEPHPQPDQDIWLALCIVAGVSIAAGAIIVVAKRCEPKFYWLMDDSDPPTFWVAAVTRKECEAQGWTRIGGPYAKASDAPAMHPDKTNRVSFTASAPVTITVEQSSDLSSWTPVYTETCDMEDFGYYPTNAAMFRLKVTP